MGAAWAAAQLGLAQPRAGALVQQCGAGLLPVRIEAEGAPGLLQPGLGRVVVPIPKQDHQTEKRGQEGQESGEPEIHG